jgi:hypothetical protein
MRRVVTPQFANALVWLTAVAAGLKALIACSRVFSNHSLSSLLLHSVEVFLLSSLAIGVVRRMTASAILLALYFAIGVAYRVAQGHGLGSSLDVAGLVLGAAAIPVTRLYPRGVRWT